jgi:hypothetical protein
MLRNIVGLCVLRVPPSRGVDTELPLDEQRIGRRQQ